MAKRVFEILKDAGIRDGNNILNSSVSTAYNGYCLQMNSSAELLIPTDSGDRIVGLLYENQQLEELPTTENVATNRAGKRVGRVSGNFEALVTRLLFSGTVTPTAGDKIWSNGDGLMTNSQPASSTGTPTALGYCVGSAPLQNDSDIGFSYQTVARIVFHVDVGGIF